MGLLFLCIDRALQFVFLSLTILFFLLAARDSPGQRHNHNIICGQSAVYTDLDQVLNEVYKSVVAPFDPV